MATTAAFNPATDIPSLAGKVILITGANSGLGRQSALELAKHQPERIWMAARDPLKGQEAASYIQARVPDAPVTPLDLDLSSFESIKGAAKTVLASTSRLDILMLNAGLMGCPPKLTKEGYEIQMGTNHLGHAFLLKLLMPLLLKTATTPRVVSLASAAWKYADATQKIQFDTLKSLDGAVTPVNRYIQSKVANVLYAQQFALRHGPRITIVSVNPGEVDTQLFKREPGDEQMKYLQIEVAPKHVRPVEDGVKNQLWAATAATDAVVNGAHYEPVGVHVEPTGLLADEELARATWDWTQKELEGHEISAD
ncbi:hypothetical protein B0H66DRAFT_576378 [Apodospora peruviana]|uniref:Uncharacterized protein n=1 Tax=Apodospora peruviana TaxID=516989 RepID=A0AAE0I2P6_9PEZI|nr:hypothetical protein B0H66DRAFT_576378 [Apodospora peruviana]